MFRRGIALLGVGVVLSSPSTLALGATGTVAVPAAPRCVPSRFNRSALLPGTTLSVSPLPDSYDASPRTQISLLGASPAAIAGVSVVGARSGNHSGRLEAYSQGDGASFVPSKAFLPGETVFVRGRERSGAAIARFAFRFVVSEPDPLPYATPTPKVPGKAGEVGFFHSQPSMRPPLLTVMTSSPGQTEGDLFAAPYSGPGQDGPAIYDGAGNLVWFHPLPSGTESTDLQVQQLEGRPVLSWWQGYVPPQGFGQGEEIVADSSYRTLFHVRAGNGMSADLHDFHIMPDSTALLTVFNTIHCDLSSAGGPRGGAVTDSLFQEIDLHTGLVRREWHPLDHVALSQSYSLAGGATTVWPFDYFHVNTVERRQGDGFLISSRNTSGLYFLNPVTNQVELQVGGKRSGVKFGPGAATAYQHDAQELPNGQFTIFDNGGVPMVHPQSRGVIVALDSQAKTDTLVSEFDHAGKALKAGSQGNVQPLTDGDYFVGWGAEPYFTEFTASGATLFDARLPVKTQSYRAYRFPWAGRPTGGPSVAATPAPGGAVTVYASWNGATAVASWRVLGGFQAGALAPVATAAREGFETAIALPETPPYVAVQALDGAGNVLGVSPTVKG